MVIDIDDEDSQRLLRLFNDPAGHDYLREAGVPEETLSQLSLLRISGIANVLCCVKLAKYYELTEHDVMATVLTDSADMYRSRIQELADQYGPDDGRAAAVDHALHLLGLRTDAMAELNYYDRKRMHNLKYYLLQWSSRAATCTSSTTSGTAVPGTTCTGRPPPWMS